MLDGRSALDARNEPDFLRRHFRSWVLWQEIWAAGNIEGNRLYGEILAEIIASRPQWQHASR